MQRTWQKHHALCRQSQIKPDDLEGGTFTIPVSEN
jgi:hypothetical protein